MAYLPNSPLEEDKKRQQELAQGGSGPMIASGPSGVITGGAPQAGQQQTKGPSKSGAYTNIGAYLNANQDQAGQLAGRVAGNVVNQAEQAQGQLQGVKDNFRQQADQNTVRYDDDLVKGAVQDPTKFTQDKSNVERFTKLRTAAYRGPQGLQDVQGFGDARQSVQNAERAVEDTKTEGGRFSLLQNQFKTPDYSRGQQRLDQVFLQNAPNARNEFQNVQGRFAGLRGMLDQKTNDASSYAAARQAETQEAAQKTQGALQGAKDTFKTGLESRVTSERERQQSLADRMQKQLAGSGVGTGMGMAQMDDDVISALGLNDGDKLYDVDLSQFRPSFDPSQVNAQTVANADDYARYGALAQLSGEDPSFLSNAQLAGRADGLAINRDGLRAQLDQARGRYDELSGRRQSLVDDFLNSASPRIGNNVQLGREANADQVAQALQQFRDGYKGTINEDWMAATEAGTNSNPLANSYRALRDWLSSYNTMTPNRTVTRRGK